MFSYLYRTGQILNVAYERTPESIFFKALEETSKQLPNAIQLGEYTTTESAIVERCTGKK